MWFVTSHILFAIIIFWADVQEAEYDPRSLYDRLQEQKDKKQEEFEEKLKFSKICIWLVMVIYFCWKCVKPSLLTFAWNVEPVQFQGMQCCIAYIACTVRFLLYMIWLPYHLLLPVMLLYYFSKFLLLEVFVSIEFETTRAQETDLRCKKNVYQYHTIAIA